ncbi:MAG TPA: helix-turn-helix domain-containing protein [Desulfosporosinus sp.]|nr:helix-turn-helix domain-containing protein [Desulfosporosinus sp.]
MAGRPSNFGKVNKDAVEFMCKKGFTDAQIQMCLHVSDKTWSLWKKNNDEFYASIKDWKAEADEKVEVSLYERACGYEHLETKVQYVNDEWQKIDTTRHYPPDPTSMIFWLKNRQPAKWRDKAEIDVTHIIDKITVEFVKAGD